MAGLYIKELMIRGALERCMVIAPGNLTVQWQEELHQKFGLDFKIVTKEDLDGIDTLNVFEREPRLIARVDQLARRQEQLEPALRQAEWDLVVVDEAHRMAAHFWGAEIKKTMRYQLGEIVGAAAQHLLLMTATPHNGKEEDFQLFLALLDSDQFAGRFRDGVHAADPSSLMRRMVKERLKTFEGRPLFPERRSTTVKYPLSPTEMGLYNEVTAYVQDQMNAADRLREGGDGRRGNTVGFALTILQRRLASSPEAIFQSLRLVSTRPNDAHRPPDLIVAACYVLPAIYGRSDRGLSGGRDHAKRDSRRGVDGSKHWRSQRSTYSIEGKRTTMRHPHHQNRGNYWAIDHSHVHKDAA